MWWTRHFLIEKIFINAHIFRNPLWARILSSLGLYGTWYKYSHLRFLSDTWPVGLSMLCSFMMDSSLAGLALKGPVLLWPMMRNSPTYLHWDPSTYISPLQLPPPPMGPSSFERKDLWGDGLESHWLTVQNSVNYACILTSCQCQEHIYDSRRVSLLYWLLSQIEVSLRLSCTSSINITPFSSHFSTFRRNILSERVRHKC